MNSPFQKEDRYTVFKDSDIRFLSVTQLDQLRNIAQTISAVRQLKNKAPLQCVVVEHDWPEYEPTWKAIEARVQNTTLPDLQPLYVNEAKKIVQHIVDWKLPETGKYYDAEQQHPMSYEMCYGSNGAREYMRNLAQDALSLLTAPPEIKETHNNSGFQNRSLNDISKRAKCFAKRFKAAIPEPNYKEQRDFLLKEMDKLACLGNGDMYGTSTGNCIAIAAIKKCNNP